MSEDSSTKCRRCCADSNTSWKKEVWISLLPVPADVSHSVVVVSEFSDNNDSMVNCDVDED
jgi:hypothetical protein